MMRHSEDNFLVFELNKEEFECLSNGSTVAIGLLQQTHDRETGDIEVKEVAIRLLKE